MADLNESKETTNRDPDIHNNEIEDNPLAKCEHEETTRKEEENKIDYFKKSDSENEEQEEEPIKEVIEKKTIKKSAKVVKKLSKKEKLKEIILTFYKDSVYHKFLECSSIMLSDILYYKFPGDDQTTLETFFIITNFGIIILLKKENFVMESQWYSNQPPNQQIPTETDSHNNNKHLKKKLPYKKEYYIIPFTMIDEIDHSVNERTLEITTKVERVTQSGF